MWGKLNIFVYYGNKTLLQWQLSYKGNFGVYFSNFYMYSYVMFSLLLTEELWKYTIDIMHMVAIVKISFISHQKPNL